MSRPLSGLWPPVSTPFDADGSVNFDRLLSHSRRLLADGAHGLAVLGTTSEANSLTLAERRRVIEIHAAAGLGDRLLPGTGACAVDDAVELARLASDAGCAGVLMLPPFYYKNVDEDGIFAFFARVIERLGADAPRILLYHIPPQTIFGFSLGLIERLATAFPGIVSGLKDSSGDWDNTRRVIEAFPQLAIFPGSETGVLRALEHGAAGCISATANINAHGIRAVLDAAGTDAAGALQAEADAVRAAADRHGLIPSIKAVLATRYADEDWLAVRPPLMPITPERRAALMAEPAIARLLAGVAA